jgi:lambda family phage portal protein
MLGFGPKKDVFDVLYGRGAAAARLEFQPDPGASSDLPRGDVSAQAPWQMKWHDGDKFAGGFGPTAFLTADYWTLRARSIELFENNLYARGLIRRLVTNVINVGLHLEAQPEEAILGYPEDGLADWSETVETRFSLWANEPKVCDYAERSTFGAQQAQAYMEALVAGDVLVQLVPDQRTKLPRVKLVSGSSVQTPLSASVSGKAPSGNQIVHGVELDANRRHVAYWVRQNDGTSKRLPAFGEKSGRRLAWLVYGSDKRLDDVRGKPILSLVLQSLKEIDRYRDSVQRKAVINAILAMYITKQVDKPGTRPIAGNAVRRGTQQTIDTAGDPRSFRTADYVPGLVLDELQVGEEPKAFQSNGTTEEFGKFEEAIVQAFAWAHQIPPEILTLAFSSNYSASQAATAEFKMFLNKEQTTWGECFCQPVYVDFLISSVLAQKVEASGFLEAWRDVGKYDVFCSWTASDWAGQIKPLIDPLKMVEAAKARIEAGLSTRAREAREMTGMKFKRNVAQLKNENAELAEANEPIAKLEAMKKPVPKPPGGGGGSGPPVNNDDDEPADSAAE